MSFPVLNQYLARLSDQSTASTSIRLDPQGRALGRFFNCTMTSAFQPVRELHRGEVVAYEGLARSVSSADEGLSLWKLLDHAASDDESVELDRLCRMLHAINFFRQEDSGDADLYLNVHDRLLSAVSSNHGYAFQRILDALGLPIARIVLLLPPVTAQQGWLLNYVADNYRRNGFRFAVSAGSAREGLNLLERVRPDVVRLDARYLQDEEGIVALLAQSARQNAGVVFKRLETRESLQALQRIGEAAGAPLLAQGYLLDAPRTLLRDAIREQGLGAAA
ncbi:EAL domain-containing protein [Pseudoduganella namucuonensis]|uniref:EAL domain, c-di-GMP-specific phosphodiesterase class I (Or its enzymatically inactive variant) n=1 Tax=Pseudoduganella namucuonensis TaxID=1035707 RepID=A0A1I7HVR9_9BURK|nr:EAL domain-containing protein [Pseudoduganella namucuonensis]SFU64596.1 EAL domain, c-di-GMP-specific phosphodiesterase class I (or its enzymatically inactive variant) [Pseudoduganella namucuonensis]